MQPVVNARVYALADANFPSVEPHMVAMSLESVRQPFGVRGVVRGVR